MKLSADDRKAIASLCGCSDDYLYQILTRRKVASAELSVLLEQKSGARITRQWLHPERWPFIWPELASSQQKKGGDALAVVAASEGV